MRAGIYGRISEDRDQEAISVSDQVKDGRALAIARGWTIAGEYPDNDISALRGKRRPGYQALMAAVDAGEIDVIVVFHTSRLWRNRRERADGIERLAKARIKVTAVKGPELDMTTAYGRGVAGLVGEFDTMESEVKSERVARAAQRRAEQGLNHGGRRTYGRGLIVDHDEAGNPIRDYHALVPTEAAEVAQMYADLIRGVPLGTIARSLNERNVPTVTGKPWIPATVRSLLQRPSNAGLSEYKGEVVATAKYPAVVSPDVYETAVALLRDPSRRTSTGNRAAYLLSGLGVCGGCGGVITSGGVKRVDGPESSFRRIYKCRRRSCVGRRQDWIDAYVGAAIIERMSRPDARELLVDEDRPDTDALRDEARALRSRLDVLATDFADGSLTGAQLRTATGRIRGRLAEVEAAQVHPTRALVLAELVEAADVEAAWKRMPLDRQRAVLAVLATVTLYPGGSGRRTFDPSYVKIDWKV